MADTDTQIHSGYSNGNIRTNGTVEWPVKKHEIQDFARDSHIWNKFLFRPDDIIVATWGKVGTLWTQQIISQLILQGRDDICPIEEAPWLEMRITPTEPKLQALESQLHRRCVKTHLPLDGLVYNHQAKYIFVARDVKDTVWSAHNHCFRATPQFYDILNGSPGRVGPPFQWPPESPRQYFLDFLEDDSNSTVFWPFWSHVRGFWEHRHLPNMLFVHYNDLKADMEAQIRRIASFLDIGISEDKLPAILEHCSFKWMKEHATQLVGPIGELFWEGGADTFINKGVNNQWKDVLTEQDLERCDAKAVAELGKECAHWLQYGGNLED